MDHQDLPERELEGQLWNLGAQHRQRVGRAEGTLGDHGGLLPLCVVGRQLASRNLRLGWGRGEHGEVLETAQSPLRVSLRG